MKRETLSEKIIRLKNYSGEDEVITSFELKDILSYQKEDIPFMSQLSLLDYYTDGFIGGELITISGPTGAGKSLLAQTFTANFQKQDITSCWFSYELTLRQFLNRFPVPMPCFALPKILKPYSLSWLEDRIIESVVKYGVKAVFIDHLHYLFDMINFRNASLQIGILIRQLKFLAVRLNIAIFLLCHMTKTKFSEEPSGSDVRDSSFVTQESDTVLIIWRVKEPDSDNYENRAKILIDKARREGSFKKYIKIIKNKGLLEEWINPAESG